MLTTGIDLIEVKRIGDTIERHGDRFLNRIFTTEEQRQCDGRLPSLAGRFAIKEAVAKALGTGIGDMNWIDIEILNDQRGRPHLHLHHNALSMANEQGLTSWAISLSHTETHAIGIAIAQQHNN